MRGLVCAAVLAAACGCGAIGEGPKTPVKLEDVPAPAMKTAKEKAPDVVNFHEAYRKRDGVLEIRGKTKAGKVVEVEVKDDGTLVDIER
ncbi:MAG TPA: hypothetical protein VH092_12165 [Urbifossiella sp.]|jgi:hypothetical protein|nr:hypothetical protein [Urbifossiella sp.]